MKTLSQLVRNKQFALLLFVLVSPFASFAETLPTAEEEATANARNALIGEVAIAVLFIAAVSAFLVYKAKHDKKVREKQLEIMKKVQAAKKRAA